MHEIFRGFGQEGALARARVVQFNPITQLKCKSCGAVHTRPHRDGDYIFGNVEEKCPNCGGTLHLIIGIYVEDSKQIKPR